MLAFLLAMMFVFFDGTSSTTKVTISSVLLVLVAMVVLLLYLEGDETVLQNSTYMRIWGFVKDSILSWREKRRARQSAANGGSVDGRLDDDPANDGVAEVNSATTRVFWKRKSKLSGISVAITSRNGDSCV